MLFLPHLIGQKKRTDQWHASYHTDTFGVILGILLMGIGMLVVRIVLEASGTPPERSHDEALIYIRIYFISLPL